MSQRITVTSTELRSIAGEMRRSAQDIGAEFGRIMAKVEGLAASWSGQAASNFSNFYSSFNANWSQCRDAIDGIAAMLSQSAEAYETTEQAVASRFNG